MGKPEDDDLPSHRARSTRRVLSAVGAVTALVTAGVMARAATGTANPTPAPSAAAVQSGPLQATPLPSTGPAGSGGGRAITPPAGNQVQDVLRAKGVLVYRCTAGRYALTATSLKLYLQNGGYAGTQSAGLTWRFKNGTRVDAALVTQQPASGTTLGQALYRVVRVRGGGANDRATTYIVRRPLTGGLPPASCTTAGKRLSIPFRTTYLFYRSTTGQTPGTARATP
jgi:hypothetical protein